MRDALNNPIKEGDMLYWKAKDLYLIVKKVSDGGLSIGSTDQKTQPSVVAATNIAINLPPNLQGQEPLVLDFIVVQNPDAKLTIQ